MAEAIARADPDGHLAFLVQRYLHLAPSASSTSVERLAADFIDLLGPDLTQFLTSATGELLRQAPVGAIPTIEGDPRLNPAQAAAMRLVADHLDRAAADRRGDSGG